MDFLLDQVCFVLVLQAALCYVPHYLWKNWEGGKLAMLNKVQ